MPVSEQQLIEQFFVGLGAERADVLIGIGDDAALLQMPARQALVLTTDALVEGVHFRPDANPRSLGHRALAVNLSDIAAMGATARWALLSLVLPEVREDWLREFAGGFGALAREHGVALVGGNLSRGPLSITVQLAGSVGPDRALRRAGARPGDVLFVSGTLGDAACAVSLLAGELKAGAAHRAALLQRLEYPTPRVALGTGLAALASACIDVSDGLYTDLGRLLAASRCGAQVRSEALPLSAALQAVRGEQAWRAALAGGEDYELCFAVPTGRSQAVQALAGRCGVPVAQIGVLHSTAGIEITRSGSVMQFSHPGFDHFSA